MDETQPPAGAEALFREYLRGVKAGSPPPTGALLERAGAEGRELERMLAVLGSLLRLADAESAGRGGSIDELGRYRDLVPIGRGGLSCVFGATDPDLDRRIAIKVLSPIAVDTERAREWTRNEARSIARIDHPGVVRVFEVGRAQGFDYIAMELVRGPSVGELLRAMRAAKRGETDPDVGAAARELAARYRPLGERCRLVAEVARALAFCHNHGVIHRDVKPSNVLLDVGPGRRAPILRLIDFGLAHLVESDESSSDITQALIGTPAYLSPEQVARGTTGTDPKSDQFSLGVLLYELLTLENPFHRATRSATLQAIEGLAPRAPRAIDRGVPEVLSRIAMRCLRRDPLERYPTIGDVAADLEAWIEDRATSVLRPGPARLAAMALRRHRTAAAAASLAIALAAVVGVVAWVASLRDERASIAAALEGLAPLASLDDPIELRERYVALAGLERRADALDDSRLAETAFAPARPAVDEAALALSRRLAEILASARATIEADRDPGVRRVLERELLARWGPVLGLDESVCPDSPHNARDRRRGRVVLPEVGPGETLTLERHELGRHPFATGLAEVEPSAALPAGHYRVSVRAADGALLRETEFPLWAVRDELVVKPVPLDPTLASDLVACEGGTIALELPSAGAGAVPAGTIEVAPFAVSRSPVTWGAVARAWPERAATLRRRVEIARERGGQGAREVSTGDAEPAVLSWMEAHEVARRLGARLPTPGELRLALLEERADLSIDPERTLGEWTSSPAGDMVDARIFFRYERLDERFPYEWVEGCHQDVLATGIVFRVARSHP